MTGVLRIPPLVVVLANLLVGSAGVMLVLFIAWNQPWLGLDLTASDQQPGLRVAAVRAGGPAQGTLSAHQRIVALGSGDARLALDARDLIEDPDFLRSYTAFNTFLNKQARLYQLLRNDSVQVHIGGGRTFSLHPAPSRPLIDLPATFWFQLVFAVMCLGIGTSVWAFQRSTATALFALTGAGLFVVGLTAAVYASRELALNTPLFRVLAAANHGGGMLFSGAFLAVLWHYPRSLGRLPVAALSLGLYLLVWLADSLQWLPNIDFGFRIPILIGLMVPVTLAVLQWRRADSPLDRAALRWFLFAWFFGSVLFIALMFVPVLAGGQPPVPQSYSFGLLLLIYIGVALGVARYRLFSLERWWYSMLAGSLALFAMLTLLPFVVRVSHLSQMATVLVAFGILGWIYFPIRNWLGRRTVRHWHRRTASVLEQSVKMLFDPARRGDVDMLWQSLLQQLFNPLELHNNATPSGNVGVSRDGSTLYVPATEHTQALEMRWAGRGARLFDDADISTTKALLPLVAWTRDLRAAWVSGAVAERARIKRDLEDDLAPRLYSQILRAPQPSVATGARSALSEVRLLIDQLGTDALHLTEALDEWRAQIQDLCEIAGLPLRWQQPVTLPVIRIDAQWRANPLRILREAVTNAIDHAHPTYMEVAITLDFPDIKLSVVHDGVSGAPESWEQGRGLLNIQARARQLDGEVKWTQPQTGSVTMQVRLCLEQP